MGPVQLPVQSCWDWKSPRDSSYSLGNTPLQSSPPAAEGETQGAGRGRECVGVGGTWEDAPGCEHQRAGMLCAQQYRGLLGVRTEPGAVGLEAAAQAVGPGARVGGRGALLAPVLAAACGGERVALLSLQVLQACG